VQRAITTADDTRLILADAQAEVDASGIRL
jgi:hypothetical protein